MTVVHGDALALLAGLADASVDAIITDPPYGLADHRPAQVVTALTAWANGDREHAPDGRGFMGRAWDAFVPPPAVWDQALRVLKPGGYLAVFAGSRTVDLMGLSIRMAGFEIRDGLQWIYGSGFPKSLDVGKAIDKAAGHTRGGYVDIRNGPNTKPGTKGDKYSGGYENVADLPVEPQTDAARQWDGWGTALKPAAEPIILARRPLSGTVAATVLAHGCGAMNIDACRTEGGKRSPGFTNAAGGRWPANVLLSHAPECGPDEAPQPCAPGCAVAELDGQSGERPSGGSTHERSTGRQEVFGQYTPGRNIERPADSGGASRFFSTFRYQAKAPRSERPTVDGKGWPTVKPLGLMRWLVRLVTPPGGLVVDPFCGTGATVQAAVLEGMRALGGDNDPMAVRLACVRLGLPDPGPLPDPTTSDVEVVS